MTTRMGAAAGGAVTKPPMSRFAAALAGARVFRLIVIPGLNVAADMTVVGHDQVQLIDGEVMVAMAELKIGPPTTLTAWSYEAERAARTLARACFDPEARAKGALVPVGTVEEWCAIPDEWLDPVWLAYKQLRAEVSPYGNEGHHRRGSGRDPGRGKKKGSNVLEVIRAREADRLGHYYGRPAVTLLDFDVWRWGVIAGLLKPGAAPRGRLYLNDAYQEP